MTENEENFPRGRIVSSKERGSFSKNVTPFPKANGQKNARKRKRSISPDNENTFNQSTELFSTAADALTYKKLQEQMLLLGCIRGISPLTLDVELPGKMAGKIQLNGISKSFIRVMKEEFNKGDVEEEKDMTRLNTMFHLGQFVPTKVMEKIENPGGTKVILSMDPRHINSDWNHTVFKEGLLLWAAVESKSDHGYVLDAGILNIRIFLSFENIDEETALVIGQPLWCVVRDCRVTSSVATVQTSILRKDLDAAIQDNTSLHFLVPGMQFNFKISKLVKYGLQGEYMSQCLGYINESYLAKPFDSMSRYRKEQTVKAWLLYVEPTTKFGHFTLRNVSSVPNPEYQKGIILRAQIVSKTTGGLSLRLPNKEKAFMSNRRLMNMLPKTNNFKESVGRKFPPDSYHQCRILDYNCMEQVYICTFEPSVLQEKYFIASDVKIGELVTGKVIMIVAEGIEVAFGKVKGFIQNIHLSSSKYSENIKKRFSKGKAIQARVLSNDERGIFLTHKQELVNSDVCLSACKDAVVNQQYPGVVVNKSQRGVLVVFYGDVRGMLFQKHLLQMYPDYADNMYYEGQVIMPRVSRVVDNFLHLSLNSPKQPRPESIQVGEYVDAVITKINSNGLVVNVQAPKIKGFIPTAHLSSSLTLTPLLLETYNVGDVLSDLLCISTGGNVVLSIREATAYRNQNLEVEDIEDIEPGALIRCSYVKSDKSGIYVSAPFISKPVTFKILNKELLNMGYNIKLLNFKPQQTIVVKVLELDDHHKTISNATAKQAEVFNGDYKYSLDLFEQYMQDAEQIRTHLLNNGSPLAKLRLGQHVACEVCSVIDSGCKVLLKNEIVGLVSPKHYAKNMKLGQTVTGVVLWVNYAEQYVEISLNENVIKKVKQAQDGTVCKSIGSSSHADLLIDRPDYMVGVLRNQDINRQLIFLPSRLHENAFLERMQAEELSKIKVVIHSKVKDKLIGMDKAIIHALKKAKTTKRRRDSKTSTSKRARLNSALNIEETDNSEEESVPNGFENNEEQDSEEENNSIDSNDADARDEDTEKGNQNGYEEEDDNRSVEEIDSEEEDDQNEEDADGDSDDENEEVQGDTTCEENIISSEEEEEEEEAVKPQNEDDEVEISSSNEEVESKSKSKPVNGNKASTKEPKNKQQCPKNIIEKPNTSLQNGKGPQSSNKLIPALPGVKHFFTEPKVNFNQESSSDEDESEKQTKEKPKKKLTPAERKELARLEEEKLIRKEIENADSAAEPQTVEQFQKLVKGKPHCSESWIKYIAYLVSNAEIEKAKGVAQEALQTINMQLTEERFNVWITRLNLENSYGDKNTFDEVFTEAVRCNDALSIYLAVIKILAASQKNVEMEEKIQKAKSKFGRESLKMWTEIGRIYYKNGQLKEARNVKDGGLLKLRLKTNQITLVVQFAIMEFQYGEKNQGEALFETLLQHNPKRVDIWTTYIDQVAKKNDVDAARRILDRAVSQSIPPKKLRTLFKKFKEFEMQRGSEEQVQHVIELARKYAAGLE